MLRISDEVAKYISTHAKDPIIPGLIKDTETPYKPKNLNTIGFINDIIAVNTDARYILESDPEMNAYFLYRPHELRKPKDPIDVPRGSIDPYTTDLEEVVNVQDCAVELPPQTEKLTVKIIGSIKRLLEVEPELKECLSEEENNGSPDFRPLF